MHYHNPTPVTSCPLCHTTQYQPFLPGLTSDVMRSKQLEQDIRNMKRYYPEDVARLSELVSAGVDRYDTRNSFIYDDYPDRVSTLHILREILMQTGSIRNEEQKIIEILLAQEILLRRLKRRY